MIFESDNGRAGSSASTSFLDPFLDDQRRDILTSRRIDPGMEEVLHREKAARRVHVLVAHHPRDGGFVHPDVFGDLAKHHGFEVLDSEIEEVPLEGHDTLRRPCRSSAAVGRCSSSTRRRCASSRAGNLRLADPPPRTFEHPGVLRVDPEPWQAIVVEVDRVFVVDLTNVDVGFDVLVSFLMKDATGFGLEPVNDIDEVLETHPPRNRKRRPVSPTVDAAACPSVRRSPSCASSRSSASSASSATAMS